MNYLYLFTLFFCFSAPSNAQKSYTIEQCEELFQKNNLLILAEQFNIDAQKALVIQAKIWEQPYVSGELNAYKPENSSVFNVGNAGQKTLAIEQLIYLGGKKKNEIEFAKSNVELAEIEFSQLIRNLRFELRKSYFEVHYGQVKLERINSQLSRLDTLVNLYAVQAQKGNVPLKDLVRLQSLSLTIKNEMFDIQKGISQNQENVKLLTRIEGFFYTQLDSDEKLKTQLKYTELELQKLALENNTDFLLAQKQIESNELNMKWQKSLAIPDITMGMNYDQRGGAFNNQVNLTFGIPLPLWNKNQGNTKRAEAELNYSKLLHEFKKDEVSTRISSMVNTFFFQQEQYVATIKVFPDFDKVYEGILQNFQKKNISIIEFTDFMESYNQSILFLNEIKKQVTLSGETINYLTNSNVF